MAVGAGVLAEGAGRAPPHLSAPGEPLRGLASISGLKEKAIDRWSSGEWVTIGWGKKPWISCDYRWLLFFSCK